MSTRLELIEAITERLEAMDRKAPGGLEDHLRDAAIDDIADEMTGPLLRRVLQDEMTDQLGPYYDTAALMRRWGVSRQAVSKRHLNGSLLGLTADDGRILFPVWQFKSGSDAYPFPLDWIIEIREILSERNVDPLSQAIWLTAPIYSAGDKLLPAYRLLNDARGAQIVRSAARSEMLRLSESGLE